MPMTGDERDLGSADEHRGRRGRAAPPLPHFFFAAASLAGLSTPLARASSR